MESDNQSPAIKRAHERDDSVKEIILFRHRGEVHLGRSRSNSPSKVLVDSGNNETLRVNPQQVLGRVNANVSSSDFGAWRDRCQTLFDETDLKYAWEVVYQEIKYVTLSQLRSLIGGNSPEPLEDLALLMVLYKSNLYFLEQEGCWIPRTEQEVEKLIQKRRQLSLLIDEWEEFVSWIKEGKIPERWTTQHSCWRRDLEGFAIFGDEYEDNRSAKQLIRALAGRKTDLQKTAFQLLLDVGIYQEHEPLGLYRRGIRLEFPPQLEKSPTGCSPNEIAVGRRDLLELPIYTIDENTTLDIDDGLSLIDRGDDGSLLGIHISDVTPLIPQGGDLDAEACRRMGSVYLPDMTVHMLPVAIAQDSGSLLPGMPRRAMSLLVHLDRQTQITKCEIVPSVVQSRARMTYLEVDQILGGKASPHGHIMRDLDAIARVFLRRRIEAGAIELRRPEIKVVVNPDGDISVRSVESTGSRRMVAEFMVLANRLLAEFCKTNNIPTIFRYQDPVDLQDIPTDNEVLWRSLALRRMKPGGFSLDPKPHGTLGLPVYLRSTSPLRRFPDLVIQRQVIGFLTERRIPYDRETLSQLIYPANTRLREIASAEVERTRYWVLRYLESKSGEQFAGVVLDARRHYSLVELSRFPFRVRIYMNGQAEIGDTVSLKLQSVDLWKLEAYFTDDSE
jgi:exoribonuclease-2